MWFTWDHKPAQVYGDPDTKLVQIQKKKLMREAWVEVGVVVQVWMEPENWFPVCTYS